MLSRLHAHCMACSPGTFTTLHGHPFMCLSPCLFVPMHGHSLLTLHAHRSASPLCGTLTTLHACCTAQSSRAMHCMLITLCTSHLARSLHGTLILCTSITAHLLFSQHIFGSRSRTCSTRSSSRWKKPKECRAAAPALPPQSVHGASLKAVSSTRGAGR